MPAMQMLIVHPLARRLLIGQRQNPGMTLLVGRRPACAYELPEGLSLLTCQFDNTPSGWHNELPCNVFFITHWQEGLPNITL